MEQYFRLSISRAASSRPILIFGILHLEQWMDLVRGTQLDRLSGPGTLQYPASICEAIRNGLSQYDKKFKLWRRG